MYLVKNAFSIEERKVKQITIRNKNNMEVTLLNYGATIVEIWVPDKNGTMENIVLTHEHIKDYIKNPSYFGATVGRTSGRIADGRFVLDKKVYDLNKNYGVNQGHGGFKGFSFQVWDYKILEKEKNIIVEFTYLSKDMEENYPGNLDVKVSYTLTENNELWIEYEAITDKRTLCNLTNHSYFNLSGTYKRKVTGQYLKIKSNHFLELNSNQIPTGKLINVKNTPMDFTELKLIGKDIDCNYQPLTMESGYDHTWILNEKENQIEMGDSLSGRKMTVTTTYPSVVVYSYNFPNKEKLKYGNIGSKYDGICFETQYEPDGMNHKNLNSNILDVDKKYYEKTVFQFSIIEIDK